MAAGAAGYKRFLQLLEKWPADKSKTGRDIKEYLCDSINIAYKDNQFEKNLKYWDRQYLALQKLIQNEHRNKHPRSVTSSATGLTAEQCNIALSSEFLQQLEDEDKSTLKRLFSLKSDK